MGNFLHELDGALLKFFAAYEEMIKKPRDYNCGIILYPSEMHMVEAVGNHPDANITEISLVLGISKGTASKMIKKLEQKGLVKKYQLINNQKEIYFELTEIGKKAYKGHYDFQESRSSDIFKKINNYTDEEKMFLMNFIEIYTDHVKRYVK